MLVQVAKFYYLYNMYIPLASRETGALVLLFPLLLAQTQMVYFVLHWILGKGAPIAVVLAPMYTTKEPPSCRLVVNCNIVNTHEHTLT